MKPYGIFKYIVSLGIFFLIFIIVVGIIRQSVFRHSYLSDGYWTLFLSLFGIIFVTVGICGFSLVGFNFNESKKSKIAYAFLFIFGAVLGCGLLGIFYRMFFGGYIAA